MQDIAYFRTNIPPETADGPVGWTVADCLREALQLSSIRTSPVKASWDGVKFSCFLQWCHFDVEFTPYFEAKPLEWSVEVRRRGFRGLIPTVWQPAQAVLVGHLNGWLTSDERLELLRWESLAELAHQQRHRTSG
jgi:hypothetical protein